MCGLVVLYRKHGYVTADDVASVRQMLEVQHHRGPDGTGLWFDDKVVMGHNRLEILDHSQEAHQPMASVNGVHVVYNGEIYNYRALRRELEEDGYRFSSDTDTEVLAHGYHAWGSKGLVQRLHGMYAFVLYSLLDGQLVAARDQFGIKPLYQCDTGPLVILASEVRTIRRSGIRGLATNQEAIIHFLVWGSMPNYVTTVDPVQAVSVQESMSSLHHCIRTNVCRSPIQANLQAIIDTHQQGVVPQCVLQSGGLDSSALVALSKLPGVTVSCPPTYDEPVLMGTPHLWQGNDDTLKEYADDFFAAMDQPSIDGFNVYLACRWAKELGFKVVWSGLGADELMGGYQHLRWAPPWKLGQWTWRGYRRLRGLFASRDLERLLNISCSDEKYPAPSLSCSQAWTFWEFDHYLKDQLLRDADTFSMAHGLELRVPYLDDRFVSHVLPMHDRGKSLLREAVKDVLPAAVLSRKKQGFTLAFDRWLMRDAGYWEDRALDNTPLVKKEVRNVWTRFRQRRLHWSRAWATVVAAQWKRWT